jgi:hypothetical protein
MTAKLTRLTHKVALQLHLVAKSCTICSSRSRQPVRKLLDTPSYLGKKTTTRENPCIIYFVNNFPHTYSFLALLILYLGLSAALRHGTENSTLRGAIILWARYSNQWPGSYTLMQTTQLRLEYPRELINYVSPGTSFKCDTTFVEHFWAEVDIYFLSRNGRGYFEMNMVRKSQMRNSAVKEFAKCHQLFYAVWRLVCSSKGRRDIDDGWEYGNDENIWTYERESNNRMDRMT